MRPRTLAPGVLLKRKRSPAHDNLERDLQVLPHKRRTQHRMALNHDLPRSLERINIKPPSNTAAQRLVIDRRLRLVETVEQDSLLKRRQRINVRNLLGAANRSDHTVELGLTDPQQREVRRRIAAPPGQRGDKHPR